MIVDSLLARRQNPRQEVESSYHSGIRARKFCGFFVPGTRGYGREGDGYNTPQGERSPPGCVRAFNLLAAFRRRVKATPRGFFSLTQESAMTTTALVPVFAGTLAGQPTRLCNARDLHTTLGVGDRFDQWIIRRIESYGFAEGEDFCTKSCKTRGLPATDYHLTLDMAKELAMVENNDRGRQVRRYFIALEKATRSAAGAGAPALSAPREPSPAVRDHITRTAHRIMLQQYEPIHAILTECATDTLACGAPESECLAAVTDLATRAGGTALVNLHDLHQLVWSTQQVIDTAAQTIAAIRRIEKRSGYQLVPRRKPGAKAHPDFHQTDRLVQEVIDRIAE